MINSTRTAVGLRKEGSLYLVVGNSGEEADSVGVLLEKADETAGNLDKTGADLDYFDVAAVASQMMQGDYLPGNEPESWRLLQVGVVAFDSAVAWEKRIRQSLIAASQFSSGYRGIREAQERNRLKTRLLWSHMFPIMQRYADALYRQANADHGGS